MAIVKIDFYRVKMPKNTHASLEQIFELVRNLPIDASRNEDINGVTVRLQEATLQGDAYNGEMIRIRMDEVPLRVSLSAGAIGPIDLDEEEGLGEETAFLYNIPLQVLVIQRNRFGVSPLMVAHYFRMKGGLTGPIYLEPVLQSGALERLYTMGIIRKFDIRIAGLENFHSFRGMGLSGNALANLMETYQAPTISLSMSMGRRRGSLSIDNVFRQIRSALEFVSTNQVKKIEVTGRENDFSEVRVIDLVKDRMIEYADVPLDPHRRLTYNSRINALRNALARRHNEIERMFVLTEN